MSIQTTISIMQSYCLKICPKYDKTLIGDWCLYNKCPWQKVFNQDYQLIPKDIKEVIRLGEKVKKNKKPT